MFSNSFQKGKVYKRKMLYVLINYRELSAPISDSNSFLNKKKYLKYTIFEVKRKVLLI